MQPQDRAGCAGHAQSQLRISSMAGTISHTAEREPSAVTVQCRRVDDLAFGWRGNRAAAFSISRQQLLSHFRRGNGGKIAPGYREDRAAPLAPKQAQAGFRACSSRACLITLRYRAAALCRRRDLRGCRTFNLGTQTCKRVDVIKQFAPNLFLGGVRQLSRLAKCQFQRFHHECILSHLPAALHLLLLVIIRHQPVEQPHAPARAPALVDLVMGRVRSRCRRCRDAPTASCRRRSA